MYSNTGFAGLSYRWFIGQVPPVKNQHKCGVKWSEAWGDRVKVRIMGLHSQDATIKDDDLPWAIVAKPTSQGNFSGGTTGIMGGEWVIGFFLDESNQIPIITHVLGLNVVGNAVDLQRAQNLGSTYYQYILRSAAIGGSPGAAGVRGGSQPKQSGVNDVKDDPTLW